MTALGSRTAAVILAVLGVMALAGCGAGRDAQTYQERRVADSTTTRIGSLVLTNVAVRPPEDGDVYKEGEDAEVVALIVNQAREEDRLVEVTTSAARNVEILGEASTSSEGLGAVAGKAEVTLLLEGLTRPLRPGEYISMTFRFEKNGSVAMLVPIALTGETDRPVYTKEEDSEEGEPALQAPTGGHSKEHEKAHSE